MRTRWHRVKVGMMAAGALLVWASTALAGDAPAEAAKPMKVAVRSFAAKGVDQSIASTLETAFCSALANQSLDVLCPEDVNALINEKQRELGVGACDNEDDCLKNIAKVSQAKRVVTGEVSKLGDHYLMSVSIIDIASGKVLERGSQKAGKPEDLLDKLDALAKKMAQAK